MKNALDSVRVSHDTLKPAQWFLRYRQKGEPRRTIGPFASKAEAEAAKTTTRDWLGKWLVQLSIYATREPAACHIRARR
jgi:hypothetical protein